MPPTIYENRRRKERADRTIKRRKTGWAKLYPSVPFVHKRDVAHFFRLYPATGSDLLGGRVWACERAKNLRQAATLALRGSSRISAKSRPL